ncbi:membrane protein [Microvirga vignae]|uniref:Membrane protein n=1 Tax=Microvirga vignae TaxID=1225564 RepID=A0A0H1RQF3_9HYPH|nr:isoprenylcysteine carboxylmethyltransferase family protein [Microvirga vignae]KLK94887.1 membrane protein [Microvirga vignae]
MSLGLALLILVTLQRVGELAWARRNTRRLKARGAVEVASRHYCLIVLMHAAWLLGLWILAWDRPLVLGWAGVYVALQVARIWVLVSLGERWTTRIIVLPRTPLVRTGPYRFMNHPNYLLVAAEIAVLPLAFGLVGYAILFSLLNATVLAIRIRAETRALNELSQPQAT